MILLYATISHKFHNASKHFIVCSSSCWKGRCYYSQTIFTQQDCQIGILWGGHLPPSFCLHHPSSMFYISFYLPIEDNDKMTTGICVPLDWCWGHSLAVKWNTEWTSGRCVRYTRHCGKGRKRFAQKVIQPITNLAKRCWSEIINMPDHVVLGLPWQLPTNLIWTHLAECTNSFSKKCMTACLSKNRIVAQDREWLYLEDTLAKSTLTVL